MTCWEYDIKSVRVEDWQQMRTDLNDMGIDGWELVKFKDQDSNEGIATAIFKRILDEVNM